MNRETMTRGGIFLALVGIAVLVRLITPWPNFGAVTSAALFAGFYFRSRWTAAAVPLAIVLVSDYFLGGYAPVVMVAVYGSYLFATCLRGVLRSRPSAARVGMGAIASAIVFFLVTNAAVWYVWYPHTVEGLLRSYAVAVPFFGFTLGSDLLFTVVLFGVHAWATRGLPLRTPAWGKAPLASAA